VDGGVPLGGTAAAAGGHGCADGEGRTRRTWRTGPDADAAPGPGLAHGPEGMLMLQPCVAVVGAVAFEAPGVVAPPGPQPAEKHTSIRYAKCLSITGISASSFFLRILPFLTHICKNKSVVLDFISILHASRLILL